MKPHKFVGGKQSKLHLLMPYLDLPTETYMEPFCGSCAILLNRAKSNIELANDINGNTIRYWRAVQSDPAGVLAWCERLLYHEDEYMLARAYLAGEKETKSEAEFAAYYLASIYFGFCGMDIELFGLSYKDCNKTQCLVNFARKNLAGLHDRIRFVQFTRRDAIDLIATYGARMQPGDDALIYLDPPYLLDSETNKAAYAAGDMPRERHAEMLAIINGMCARNPSLKVAISGYRNPLYDEALATFDFVGFEVACNIGNRSDENKGNRDMLNRMEGLWRNYEGQRKKLL